nr:hypothetical protein CFP56_74028 [Quercus suber]
MTCQQFWSSCLDYEEKFAMAQSKANSLSFENEVLKAKVTSLSNKMEKAQDRLKILERDVNIEKAFSKLKDKQIDDALLKIQKAGPKAMEKFKKCDEYSNKLCDYYVDGFELFCKYIAKHHPDLDFSTLNLKAVENEILEDCSSNDAEVDIAEDVVGDDTVITTKVPMDPSPSNLLKHFYF